MKHESDLNISYTKIGDYYFPNIAPTGCRRHWHLGQTAQGVPAEASSYPVQRAAVDRRVVQVSRSSQSGSH